MPAAFFICLYYLPVFATLESKAALVGGRFDFLGDRCNLTNCIQACLNSLRNITGIKILIAAAAGLVGFALADQAFHDGRLVQSLPGFARAIAAAFGLST